MAGGRGLHEAGSAERRAVRPHETRVYSWLPILRLAGSAGPRAAPRNAWSPGRARAGRSRVVARGVGRVGRVGSGWVRSGVWATSCRLLLAACLLCWLLSVRPELRWSPVWCGSSLCSDHTSTCSSSINFWSFNQMTARRIVHDSDVSALWLAAD